MDGVFSLSPPPLHHHLLLRERGLTREHKFPFVPGVATFYLTHLTSCPTALGGVEALVKWLWRFSGSVPDVLCEASALSGITSLPLRNNGWAIQFHTGVNTAGLTPAVEALSMWSRSYRQGWKKFEKGEKGWREEREREGEKVMGREKGRPTQTDMLPIRHIPYFYSFKDCQVHYTARVEEQVLEVCSWHSGETFRTTSLYFIQHSAKACLFVQCNANSNLSQCHSPRDLLNQQKSQASWSHSYSPRLSHYEFCTVTAATEASPCLTKQLLSTVLYYWLAEEQAPRFLSFFFPFYMKVALTCIISRPRWSACLQSLGPSMKSLLCSLLSAEVCIFRSNIAAWTCSRVCTSHALPQGFNLLFRATVQISPIMFY